MKKTGFFFTLFTLLFTAALAEEIDIKLTTSTGDIHGTLRYPDTGNVFPIVILHTGSGPTDRNCNQPQMATNAFLMLADSLEKYGIASLRYDKRGVGESQQALTSEADLRLDHYIDDLKLWVKKLAEDDRFSEIYIAGHSEGSQIGLAASVDNPQVEGMIAIAGAGRTMDVLIMEQLRNQALPEPFLNEAERILTSLANGQTAECNVPQLAVLFRPSVQPYWISCITYDPAEMITHLDIPVLILQGTTDIQITETDAKLLHDAQPKARMVLIEGMNHVLKNCETKDQQIQMATYFNPQLPINSQLVKEITDFVHLTSKK